MSQTWVIKDTAPVDEASLTLATTNISFTTNNEKATSIGIVQDGSIVMLIYGGIDGGAQFDLSASSSFEWYNEAYRTLEFDTAPTGELLAWLQKNADKQVGTEYLTNTAELMAVANAIREKGGTSEQLACPDGFVAAIQAIQTGVPLQIAVTTNTGATVTATKGSKTVSGTADTSGHCTLTVDEAGTWTVTAATASTTKTSDVVVGISNVDLPLVDSVFGNNSWAAIIKACQEKQVPETWKVGDSCNMTINNKTYAIDIIGKNHDEYSDDSGKAPLTFQMHDCYGDTKKMNSSDTNSGGWLQSEMRTTHLPAILALMPTEVQNGIREVLKKTHISGTSSMIVGESDKLFLLSVVEIFGAASGEGTQYDYYKAGNSKVKKWNGSAVAWWERSPSAGSSTSFCVVSSSGSENGDIAGNARGVAFGFCF